MKCADPKLCYTSKYTGKRQFRHFSLASRFFKTLHNEVFDCGHCLFCRKKRALELSIRCVLHASMYHSNCFVTLTYDENKAGYHNNFDYKEIQDFKKRLRMHCQRHHSGKKIEIFNVHEYGKNGKKHWHLVIFNHDFSDKTLYTVKKSIPLYTSKTLEKLWPFGFNTIGDVTEASAMYQAQYTQKDIKNGNQNNSKKSDSKHKGIGKPYFLRHFRQILSNGYISFGTGTSMRKVPIPRSFEKIAHKHYSHFHEPENFFDNERRKKLYTPFKPGQENSQISDLYIHYRSIKDEQIEKIKEEWDKVIQTHLNTGEKPEFIKSAENALYDLKNKLNIEQF